MTQKIRPDTDSRGYAGSDGGFGWATFRRTLARLKGTASEGAELLTQEHAIAHLEQKISAQSHVQDPPVPPRQGDQRMGHRDIATWRGKDLLDCDGDTIGALEDVYVDVETNEPVFGTVKVGLIGRRLAFVPLGGLTIGPENLQVTVRATR